MALLGIAIGIGGLWICATLRSIADEAKIGAVASRRYVIGPRGLLPRSRMPREPSDGAFQPIPLRVSAGPESEPGATASADGRFRGISMTPPRFQVVRYPLSTDDRSSPAGRAAPGIDHTELHRLEEMIANCTEATRLAPDSPRLYLERAGTLARLDHYEEAVVAYDRAVALDEDNAAAYFRRCQVRSELGPHEEAVEDYDQLMRLDPESRCTPRDL